MWHEEGGLTEPPAAPALRTPGCVPLPASTRPSPSRRGVTVSVISFRPAGRRRPPALVSLGPDGTCVLKGCPALTPAFPGLEPAEPQQGRRGVPGPCSPAPPGSARGGAGRGGTRRASWALAPPSGGHLGTGAAGVGASTLRSRQPSILGWPRGGGRAAPCSPEANARTGPPEAGSAGRNRSRFVLHLRKCLRAYSHSILVYQNEMQGTKNNIIEGSKSEIK
ncbi:probable G-protein coupled receptor 160 isoform X2 [Pan paniscus]|uniref:probable G-protein coupled receptor 160 isoform X2 n=1 Tax=Pan paniscus TaxID=9597 RepID=UPI002436CCD8|nr:probable G-protein coupled receptor 160 isoform X2 [Pan paniscus]